METVLDPHNGVCCHGSRQLILTTIVSYLNLIRYNEIYSRTLKQPESNVRSYRSSILAAGLNSP